jgi:hypothetical protein
MVNKYFIVESDKIYLSKSANNSFQGSVILKNITENFLIFKTMINRAKQYTAYPSCSFIAPYSTSEVQIKRLVNLNNEVKDDFFLFKAYPVTYKIKDVSNYFLYSIRQKKQKSYLIKRN